MEGCVIFRHQSQAVEMRAKGMLWKEIAAHFGVDPDTAHRWADPSYHAKRLAKDYRRKRSARAKFVTVYDETVSGPSFPTLAYVPGIVVTGRYQMMRSV
jgi:hypothetical protein